MALTETLPLQVSQANRQRAVIVDLDGTLATLVDRDPFEYAKCGSDKCNDLVADLMAHYASQGHTVIIATGRPDSCHDLTVNWLVMNMVRYDLLFMRLEGDWRKDATFKTELYHQAIEQFYDVKLCLDDRDSSVLAWRMLGLPCWQVAPGDF